MAARSEALKREAKIHVKIEILHILMRSFASSFKFRYASRSLVIFRENKENNYLVT